MSKRLSVLHQHSPAWGLPTFDPFCLSAYAYMRFTGVEFSVANGNNPGISTTGSLPALEEGERLHCGLDAILDHLENR
ncbi:GST C-terminal domain-containing protein [Balamuthia mandrillaris]